MRKRAVTLTAIPEIPLIKEGDNLGEIIVCSCRRCGMAIQHADILVIAQKVVSKSEGATVNLGDIAPSINAIELATATGRDPRLCQVYLNESDEVLSVKGRMVITRHRLGFECSGAGVDRSNVSSHEHEVVVLLPSDPDQSAREIRKTVKDITGTDVAVIINDSFGRHDRDGSIGTAIGIAGIGCLETRRQTDLFGNVSNAKIALVDEVAAAASILMGQADESIPVVLVSGVEYTQRENTSLRDILIAKEDAPE